MNVPVLDRTLGYAGSQLPLSQPRNIADAIVGGVYKCLAAHAANPLELSDACYGSDDGVETLMVINDRKSPFDFENGDIIAVADIQQFDGLTSDVSKVASTTQPSNAKKTSSTDSRKQSTSTSPASNTSNKPAMQINSTIGKITF